MALSSDASRLRWLGVAGVPIYAAIAYLAEGFRPEAETPPPLLAVLSLLAVACLLYLLALRLVVRDAAASLRTVLFFSLAYRLILLPSWPIQEIDFYRYLWDGRVTLNGSNPYLFSPTQIDEAEFREVVPPELAELRRLSRETPAMRTIFDRVHYRDIPTAYPPLSQAVFAFSAWLTPADASVWLHVMILKSVLLAFDVGTLLVLVRLLRQLGFPAAAALAYGWCPLVLKEFANTAHLDTMAVFFTTLALYLLVSKDGVARACLALGVLGLGVLAKSYPVILLPLVTVYLFRRLRLRSLIPTATFLAIVVAGYLPFHLHSTTRDAHHAGTGVGTFLFTRWEMNDLLFMLVYRNVARTPPAGDAWFVIVPPAWREALNARLLDSLGDWERLPDGADPAYLLTLGIMGSVLLLICLIQMIQVWRQPEPRELLRACFLVLAWGWLLSSTQNPWYVLWCLPLMLFARSRSWFLMPCLALVYYLRFWFVHWAPADPSVGYAIFDYGIVWLEYAPLLICLGAEAFGWFPWASVRCPEGAKQTSPGQRPGNDGDNVRKP